LDPVDQVSYLDEDILLGLFKLQLSYLLRCFAGAITIALGNVIQRHSQDYPVKVIRIEKAVSVIERGGGIRVNPEAAIATNHINIWKELVVAEPDDDLALFNRDAGLD